MPQVDQAVDRVRAALTGWMFEHALPFWSRHGFGPKVDGACPSVEHLTLDGVPADPGYTRMRVQARQLHVFSIAAERGVAGASAHCAGLYRFMTRHGRADDAWVRRLAPDGGPNDDTIDLYDNAFVLFALAHHARASGDTQPLRDAERTLRFLRRHMAHPAGGFLNVLPAQTGWRLQNPHMHLLEAAQALFEVSRNQLWADLALELADLFHRHLLDSGTGTLAEHFTEDWQRAPGIDGAFIEPGHQVEWIWLLDRQQTLFGDDRGGAAIARLARVLVGHGVGAETGLMRDEIGTDGSLHRGSSRLWPQTELLRAACVLARRATKEPADQQRALSALVRSGENLLGRYLVGGASEAMPPGTWIDQLDAFGQPISRTIPTSSFYHIMTGWLELDGFMPPPLIMAA